MAFQFDLKVVTGDSAGAVLATAHGLEATDKGARHAAEGVKLFESEVGKLSGSVGGLSVNLSALSTGGSLFVFDLAEGARFAFEAVSKLVEKVVDLGKEMVHAVAGAETLGVAMKYQLGDEKAEAFGQLAELYARKTGYDDDFFKSAWLPLFKAGVKDKEQVALLTTTAAELAAQNNEGGEAIKGYLNNLSRIALGGKIKEGALKDFGIAPQKFYAVIAAAHKTTMDEAAKLLKAGKLSSEELLTTIVSQVAANSGDASAIGKAALARGDTLDATLQRLHDLPENIFKRLQGSEGMTNLKGAIDNFIGAIEEKAPAALASFNRAFTQLFGDLTGPEGFEKIKAGIDVWLGKFEVALPIIVSGAKEVLGVLYETSKVILEIAEAWPRIANILGGAAKGAALGAPLGVPGMAVTAVGGAALASIENDAIAQHDAALSLVRRGAGNSPSGRQITSTSNVVNVPTNITIHATGAEDAAEQYERHMRQSAVRVGQELSSYVGKPGGNQ